MSFLDGYLGYNQILMNKDDRLKIIFTSKWGAFSYSRMSFDLINANATFQFIMDYAFHGLLGKSIIIYMDDLTIFSKYQHSHVDDLRIIFERCRKFGISLNPKKCIFRASKGRLLGHIISEHGISINLKRVQAIQMISYPISLNEVRSFIGKINFIWKFISRFMKVVKPIIAMMKEKSHIKWDRSEDHLLEHQRCHFKSTYVDNPRL